MGKKQADEHRQRFIEGALDRGHSHLWSNQLFDRLLHDAGYAFNRSHAVEYTLISYQAAYLKAHYLVEFYTASMGIADED
jgi:DNA polymerase-3 subunit alpha